ncbi:MAG: ferrochelatase [Rhodospirillales bacterium]|nr:ferrochelatase [Rhodospirillales bacterium]
MGMPKTAVVLFNLGGPDSLDAVRPFLFNLFNDPAIIGAPGLIRTLLAYFISTRRAPTAKKIYEQIGGRSPLLPQTENQAKALEETLNGNGAKTFKVFVCMRYWHPMSDQAAAEVAAFAPDDIVLLPLYPQFSTTTTGSSIADWKRAAKAAGLSCPTRAVCCYPAEAGWVAAQAKAIGSALAEAAKNGPARLLFSAHGLPKKVVDKGDPYVWQVERTAAAVVRSLGRDGLNRNGLDWAVCYQSRVGPLEWIGPNIEDELKRAAADGVAVAVAPIAFVSEHSETLVELDIEYRQLAGQLDIPGYLRVPAVGVDADFIGGLAGLVLRAQDAGAGRCLSGEGDGKLCPSEQQCCIMGETV